jgi:Kef-type K+ transport system membrane component KefB
MLSVFDMEDGMTLTERYQWAYAFAVALTSGAYFVWLGVQLSHTPAEDIEYVVPMLWTLLASFIVHSFGRGFAAGASRKDMRVDDRDKEVGRRADALSFIIFSVLVAVPMALGLAGMSTFWMTNALFLAFSLTAVANVAIKAVYYRRGVL